MFRRVEPRIDGVQKIAVLRANAVGDFVCSLPALLALKATYQGAELVLLATPWHQRFLQGRPGPVDRTVVVPPFPGIREHRPNGQPIGELDDFFESMETERFDLAVQLHGGGKNSNPFIQKLRPRLSIGTRAPEAPPLDRWIHYDPQQKEVIRQLEVAALAGALPVTLEPSLNVTDEDLAEAVPVLTGTSGRVVVLHPGAKDPRRRWPAEHFAAVADALVDQGASVIVNGTTEEKHIVADVCKKMRNSARCVPESLSLGGLLGLLSLSDLLVTNDSGPLHLAVSVGTRTVSVFWCGNVLPYAPVASSQHRVHISWRMDCPVCHAHGMDPGCSHRDSFVAGVKPDQVLESALALCDSIR